MFAIGPTIAGLTKLLPLLRQRRFVSSFERMAQRLLGVVFVIVLATAAIGSAASMFVDRAAFPETSSWKKIPARFETFLNDHVAGRSRLLDLGARLKMDALDSSPTPRVWIGSKGMLFYNHRADLAADYVGADAENRCVEHWSALTRARRDWCQKRGIPFWMLVVPDKQNVYTERLPPAIRYRQGDSVYDRLWHQWQVDQPISTIDVRTDLRDARFVSPVYRLCDTHWTPYGCWLGYCRTVEALAIHWPNLMPRSWSSLAVEKAPHSGGDLWRLLGLSRDPPAEEYPSFRLPDSKASAETQRIDLPDEDRLGHLHPVVWTNASVTGPRVVMFCDSFVDRNFQELLAQDCSRLVIVPTFEMIESIIEQERPDAVIFETVERSILATRPRLPKWR